MSLLSRIRHLRDRPIVEHEQHTVILALLVAAALALASTRGDLNQHPARPSASASPAIPAPPTAVFPRALAVRVAREFLAGYLAYAYGHAPATPIHDATSALRRSLENPPARVTPAMRASHPHLISVRVRSATGARIDVTALVNDGGLVDYPISLILERHAHRLVVCGLGGSR